MPSLPSVTTFLLALHLLILPAPTYAQVEAVPLNDYQRLGQRFRVSDPLEAIRVTVPSWSDNEGGFTITLWDSPERRRLLARAAFTNVADNAQVVLRVPRPLPAGSYYWEISARTGNTRVGLYASPQPAPSPEECIYLDGVPDPRRRFMFGVVASARIPGEVEGLMKRLETGSPLERAEACRQLAVVGGAAAVPLLARLLPDPALSHMARFALEPMPAPAAEKALLEALGTVSARQRVGIVNSLAARRAEDAIPQLRELMRSQDTECARAAVAALGRIGTARCADILEGALKQPDIRWGAALYHAGLDCASALARSGASPRAHRLFQQLMRPPAPEHVREAAARGLIETAGKSAAALLVRFLRGQDAGRARAALWVANRGLPGVALTRRLVEELDQVPEERRGALVRAIASRHDSAAPAALSRLIAGPDAFLAQAARDVLINLPVEPRERVIGELLNAPAGPARMAGISLVRDLRMPRFAPGLRPLLGAAEPEVRVAALKVMAELADTRDLPLVLEALKAAPSESEAEAAELAVSSICGRAADSEQCVAHIATVLPGVPADRKPALLRLLGTLGGAAALSHLRAALSGTDEAARAAALEALFEWKTQEATPDLLQLARAGRDAAEKIRALRGLLGIAGNRDLPADQRMALCREAQPLIQRDEEKVLLLNALGTIAAPESVAMAAGYLGSPAIREEAAEAVLNAAEPLIETRQAAAVRETLEKVAAVTASPQAAQRARALLARLRD